MTAHGEIASHGLLSVDDHHLATALPVRRVAEMHVTRIDRSGFAAEGDAAAVERDGLVETGRLVEQTSSIDALLHGAYEGDVTFAELAAHGDMGIGTVQYLDGEMLALDGEFLQVRGDGSVHRIDPSTSTPFAVICHFVPDETHTLEAIDWAELTNLLDTTCDDALVQAVRLDGSFRSVSLRSVPRQHRPYPPLDQVVAHQRTWEAHDLDGTVIGFRFPSTLQGIEVAGLHLHFISTDRSVGGHVTGLSLSSATLQIQQLDELHVEVPAGVVVAAADDSDATAAAIRAVEGGT